MSNISEPFIKRPVMTTLLTVFITVFGVYSYYNLPISNLPRVEYPVISVGCGYSGASPETMANAIASPLEREFMTIEGLQSVSSSNSLGSTSLTLIFNLDKNIDIAAMDVQAAISRAKRNLPTDLTSDPSYSKSDPNSSPIFYVGIASNTMTAGDLYSYVDTNLIKKINIVPGVSKVDIYSAPKVIRINVDLNKLYARNLTTTDVVSAVKKNSALISTGQIKGNDKIFTLLIDGQLTKSKEYANIILKTENNSHVYMKDVANSFESTAAKDLKISYWAKGIPEYNSFIVLAVNKTSDANTTDVSEGIKNLLPELRLSMPESIAILPIYDQSKTILESIDDVKETVLIAFFLVVLVVFLFLGRIRETLIPCVAIPLSLFITFIAMKALGFYLDHLSLMALTLAIGFLVDDAIVFLENMVRRMENGESPMNATMNSAKQISFTILSMTVSLCATFIPLVFMQGQVGRVFREFSITILVAIMASGIVSLTLTPLMCSKMLTNHGTEKTFFERLANNLESKFLEFYKNKLKWVFKHTWISLATWILCLIATVVLFVFLPKTFLPIGDSSFIHGMLLAKEGTAPQKMREFQEKFNEIVKTHPSVSSFASVAGGHNNRMFTFIVLKPKNERLSAFSKEKNISIEQVAMELRQKLCSIPGIMPLLGPVPSLEIETGGVDSSRGKYVYTLSGINQKEIELISNSLKERFYGVKGIIPMTINSNLELKNPQISVDIMREKAAFMGISSTQIQSLFQITYSEKSAYTVNIPGESYDVIVETEPDQILRMDNLSLLNLKSASGQFVPFNSIMKSKMNLGPVSINHLNCLPAADIYFDIFPGVPMSFVTEQVSKIANEIIPAGVVHKFRGEAETFKKTVFDLTILIFVAIFVMYIILGILYENFIHPLTVLSTLPVAIFGGLLTLYVFDAEFSLYAFIGIFMLMGIIKKNGIILIDFAIEQVKTGISPTDAIYNSCLQRFRPILMTTVSTIAGAIPIAFGWGADGVSRMPLGLTVVGGLVFAQVLTLFVTPVLYLVFERFNKNKI